MTKTMKKSDVVKILDEITATANNESETAEMPCHDGWHTGEHATEVIRIGDLEDLIEKIRERYKLR